MKDFADKDPHRHNLRLSDSLHSTVQVAHIGGEIWSRTDSILGASPPGGRWGLRGRPVWCMYLDPQKASLALFGPESSIANTGAVEERACWRGPWGPLESLLGFIWTWIVHF